MLTIALLICSNIFMTFAWYGHLKFPNAPLWQVVLISWGIAFFEYLLMVPANRWGYGQFTGAQLKTIQEIVTLTVFAGFAVFWLGETLKWNHLAAFGCLVGAAFFMFWE
ncbi:DMT family protein [Halotia wernerae UHCC 0503]|nr:DMT family protein [Halotia wernerae UHCC 0503]